MSYSDMLERIIKNASDGDPQVAAAIRKALEGERGRARLERAMREETTLDGAIEKALRRPTVNGTQTHNLADDIPNVQKSNSKIAKQIRKEA